MNSQQTKSANRAPNSAGAPTVVDRSIFQAELDNLRVREKAHTHEGDAIAAARRRLPMVHVDPTITLVGPHGPVTLLDAFEGRGQLIVCITLCGTPAALRRSNARGAPGLRRKLASCPTFIPATSPSPFFAKDHTKRVPGIAILWVGKCRGIRPNSRSTLCWLGAESAGCISYVTCARNRMSSRLTGPQFAA
jgi:hypothetical protein